MRGKCVRGIRARVRSANEGLVPFHGDGSRSRGF